jgi:hypothetical protein
LEILRRGAKAGLDVAVDVVVPETLTAAEGVDTEEGDTEVLPPTGVAVTCCNLGSRASDAADNLELAAMSPFKAEGEEEAAEAIVDEGS